MGTSGIDHTSNIYYYAVMDTRNIFCLRQGRDDPTEAYCRRFEAAISTDELEKCNATTHIDIIKPMQMETMKMAPRVSSKCV